MKTLPTFLLAASLAFLLTSCKKAAPPTEPRSEAADSTRAPQTAAPAGQSSDEADRVVLKAKWPVGSRLVYRMDMDQHSTNHIPQLPRPMQQDVGMAMTYAMSVIKETEAGGRELEMEFLANEMEIKMADQIIMSFDSKEKSDAAAPPGPQAMLAEPFRKMIGSKVRMQLDASGKVDKVLNLDEWLDTLGGEGPSRGMMAQQFNEGYFRQVGDLTSALPPKPVKAGDSWPLTLDVPAGPVGKITVNATVTYKGNEPRDSRNCAVLESTGTFKGGGQGQAVGPLAKMTVADGKMAGKSWFDPERGALVETTNSQTMRIIAEMSAPPNGAPGAGGPAGKITIDLGQQITLKLVEVGTTGK